MPRDAELEALIGLLAGAGFIAADEEAGLLLAAAAGDRERRDALVRRRLTGEPLAWITGTLRFGGVDVRIDPGVYVPRWPSEALAERAAQLLPADGIAVDLCTGSGAIARVLGSRRPRARVVATEVDHRAAACAAANGVEVHHGDLFAPLPADLAGRVDVVVAVGPYVPTSELGRLQRDTFTFETALAYDGGPDGTDLLHRVVAGAPRWLRAGGALLLELGGDQASLLTDDLAGHGYADVEVLLDEDGDVRGVTATLAPRGAALPTTSG